MTCPACGTIGLGHRACKKCGKYGDRSVKKTGMEEVKKVLAKTAKKPVKAPKTAKAKKITDEKTETAK
jgi:ribosome-binding protein aMBF1 (putative translation factor)